MKIILNNGEVKEATSEEIIEIENAQTKAKEHSDAEKIKIDLAKTKNIAVLVDGTQGAPHLQLDMQDLGCDFYAISCHKMYGPNGLGILYEKKNGLILCLLTKVEVE